MMAYYLYGWIGRSAASSSVSSRLSALTIVTIAWHPLSPVGRCPRRDASAGARGTEAIPRLQLRRGLGGDCGR